MYQGPKQVCIKGSSTYQGLSRSQASIKGPSTQKTFDIKKVRVRELDRPGNDTLTPTFFEGPKIKGSSMYQGP